MASTALPEKIESIQSGGAAVTIIDSGDIADCRNRNRIESIDQIQGVLGAVH